MEMVGQQRAAIAAYLKAGFYLTMQKALLIDWATKTAAADSSEA